MTDYTNPTVSAHLLSAMGMSCVVRNREPTDERPVYREIDLLNADGCVVLTISRKRYQSRHNTIDSASCSDPALWAGVQYASTMCNEYLALNAAQSFEHSIHCMPVYEVEANPDSGEWLDEPKRAWWSASMAIWEKKQDSKTTSIGRIKPPCEVHLDRMALT